MKVFLSHSTKDVSFVERLDTALAARGIETWRCEKDIDYGANFVAEIDRGLAGSDLAFVVLSPEAVVSAWTRTEWTSALARQVEEGLTRLALVLVRDCKPPELLRTLHRFDARTDPQAAIAAAVDWAVRLRDRRRLVETQAPQYLLEYEPRTFIGREQHFTRLRAELADQPGKFLLYGEPGTGKSTLALKFAWQARHAFDAVVFQPCGDRDAGQVAVELAARLGLEEMRGEPADVQAEAAKRWLRGRLSLLVLDDVWRADAATLLPGPPASVLVTSRWRDRVRVDHAARDEVKRFTEPEAEALFAANLGAEEVARNRGVLMAFARRMDWSPLALSVASALLRDTTLPLQRAAARIGLADLEGVGDLLERAVDAQPERERGLLQAMAVCAPESFWLPLAAEIASLDEDAAEQAADRLFKASVVRVVDRDRRRFQLHALLREQMRSGAAR